VFSFFAACVAIYFAYKANETANKAKEVSEKANHIQLELAKRNSVIELHHAWNDVNSINRFQPDLINLKNALNALSLTASLINHDVMKIEIIYDQYWLSFKELYKSISEMNEKIHLITYVPNERLTKDIKMAYKKLLDIEVAEEKRIS